MNAIFFNMYVTDMPEFVDLLTQGTLIFCKKWLRRWDVVQVSSMHICVLLIVEDHIICNKWGIFVVYSIIVV